MRSTTAIVGATAAILGLAAGAAIAGRLRKGSVPVMSPTEAMAYLKSRRGNLLATQENATQAAAALQALNFPWMAKAAALGIDPEDMRMEAPWAKEALAAEFKRIVPMMEGKQ